MLQFTLADLPQSLTSKLRGEPLKREAERRSHDLFRIVNPTLQDYKIIFDSRYIHTVPAANKDLGYGKGQLGGVERHIAHKYVNEMTWKIISEAIEFEIDRLNGVRKKKGMPIMTTFQGGEEETESNRLMRDWEKKTPELWKTLCPRKEQDYGIMGDEGKRIDEKSPAEIAVEEIENMAGATTPIMNEEIDKKEELLKEVGA